MKLSSWFRKRFRKAYLTCFAKVYPKQANFAMQSIPEDFANLSLQRTVHTWTMVMVGTVGCALYCSGGACGGACPSNGCWYCVGGGADRSG